MHRPATCLHTPPWWDEEESLKKEKPMGCNKNSLLIEIIIAIMMKMEILKKR